MIPALPYGVNRDEKTRSFLQGAGLFSSNIILFLSFYVLGLFDGQPDALFLLIHVQNHNLNHIAD